MPAVNFFAGLDIDQRGLFLDEHLFAFVGAKTRSWADTGVVSASIGAFIIDGTFSTRWVEIKAILIGKPNQRKYLFLKIQMINHAVFF